MDKVRKKNSISVVLKNSLPDKLRPHMKFALAENQEKLSLRRQQMYLTPLSKCINQSTREKVSGRVTQLSLVRTPRPRVPPADPIRGEGKD